MTLAEKIGTALGRRRKPGLQVGPTIDMNSGQAVTDGPRAYINTYQGAYVPLTMAGLAVSVDEGTADSILTEIERRLAAVERDRAEFIEARRAQALSEHIKFHHPRIAREFERVSLVKRSLRIKAR